MKRVKRMMKAMRFPWFLMCLVAFAVVGCQRHSAAWSVLNAADKLMEERPDSALKMLEGISPDTLTHSEEKAYHGLLLTQAQDKSYIVRTSDSLMLAVVDYYEHHRNPERLMRSYYYLGTVYEDLQDAPQAVDYYQRAIQVAPQGSERLQGLIYSRMGGLLINRRLRQEGVEAYRQSYHLALQSNDTLHLAHRLKNLGRAFASLHQADSCLYYYNLAIQYHNNPQNSSIKSEASGIYLQLEQYDKVRELIDGNPRAFNQWAQYYQGVGMRDSAIWWFQQSRQWANIYARQFANEQLSHYAAEEGRLVDALQYLQQALVLQDSIQKIEQVDAVKLVESQYNYQLIDQIRKDLALRQERSQRQLQLLMFVLISVFAALVALYTHYRRRMADQLAQKERADSLAKLVSDMRREMEQQAASQTKQIKSADLHPIYDTIIKNWENPSFVLDEDQRRAFLKEVDTMYANFVTKLSIQCPALSQLELLVCCLIKINMSVSQIAQLTCRASNSISTMRKRMYEKIFHKSGTQKMLDEYLMAL